MRYVIAMAVAIVVALLATLFLSQPLANWVVRQYTFDSPDTVDDLHRVVFMGSNLVALLIGWGIGWVVGGRFVRGGAAA
jgi:vancomycin permeability regulator SanA